VYARSVQDNEHRAAYDEISRALARLFERLERIELLEEIMADLSNLTNSVNALVQAVQDLAARVAAGGTDQTAVDALQQQVDDATAQIGAIDPAAPAPPPAP
jgi:hypothetical protein